MSIQKRRVTKAFRQSCEPQIREWKAKTPWIRGSHCPIELEQKWQAFHKAHAKYRWISKKGNRIQGQADRKRKRADPTLIDWKEHYSKVQSELIARTATLERRENNVKYTLTRKGWHWP
jgi:hypothetical protein